MPGGRPQADSTPSRSKSWLRLSVFVCVAVLGLGIVLALIPVYKKEVSTVVVLAEIVLALLCHCYEVAWQWQHAGKHGNIA